MGGERTRGSDERSAASLVEAKLRPPPPRSTVVPRHALLDRLDAARDVPITCVVAPAGYGKTTLLAEWAHRAPKQVAWVSIDRQDNDLSVLMSYVATALDRVERLDPELLRPASRRSAFATASRVASAISSMQTPVVLVFDHIEALEDGECRDAIAEVALQLPGGSRIALATRHEPPIPLSRLRANGDVVEVGVDDLAMTTDEARALLRSAGVELSEDDLNRVVERTEGWPVGLYLAALALKAGSSGESVGVPFSGDDRLMADYLRSEVLSNLSPNEVAFLTQSSVLDRMSGPLCDATLERAGSAEMLDTLARSNLLLVPLDRRGHWYRYHHLFRDLLLAELHRRDATLVGDLHLRAATWYEANGLPELAIDHAQAGDDPERVNRLVLSNAVHAYSAGRSAAVRRWLEWFEARGLIEEYPAVAILGALYYSNAGDAVEAERFHSGDPLPGPGPHASAAVRERASTSRVLPDGSTLESWLAVLRLVLCPDGPDGLRRDAQIALAGLSRQSGYRAAALLFEAESYLLEGDTDRAEPILARSADVAVRMHRRQAAIVATAELGFIVCANNEWIVADEHAQRALSIVRAAGLEDYPDSGLSFILAARVALHRGDIETGRDFATRAARLRPFLTYSRPAISLRSLLELARVYIALADASGAREVLRQARDILQQRPRMGVIPDEIDALRSRLDRTGTGVIGASSLTAAELRLVPLLSTHLTFPQIGERLFISRNTVKAHAISIYQKLGVSSRSEAIERLREVGLIEA